MLRGNEIGRAFSRKFKFFIGQVICQTFHECITYHSRSCCTERASLGVSNPALIDADSISAIATYALITYRYDEVGR